MIGGGQVQTLVCLGHQVADVNLGGGRVDDGVGDAVHQQVRDEAGEQRAGTDADDIGTGDGVEGLGHGIDVGRNEKKFLDAAFAGGDLGLSADTGAVLHQSFQFDIRSGGGIN